MRESEISGMNIVERSPMLQKDLHESTRWLWQRVQEQGVDGKKPMEKEIELSSPFDGFKKVKISATENLIDGKTEKSCYFQLYAGDKEEDLAVMIQFPWETMERNEVLESISGEGEPDVLALIFVEGLEQLDEAHQVQWKNMAETHYKKVHGETMSWNDIKANTVSPGEKKVAIAANNFKDPNNPLMDKARLMTEQVLEGLQEESEE